MELINQIKELEQANGRKFTKKEKVFALHLATSGNKAEAARQAGYNGPNVRSQGYNMAQDQDIKDLVKVVNDFQTVDITEDFIKQGIIKEALTAGAPRDRLNAFQLLAKTKGMLKDVQEITTPERDAEEIADEVTKVYGKEAGRRAREDLGLKAV